MKYAMIIGFLLVAIGLVAAYVGKIEFSDLISESSFALGILYGGGLGLILGGLLGWLYKKPYETKNSANSTKESTSSNLSN
jgi:uncharacterized membrane protein YciS (DUF1049 family)